MAELSSGFESDKSQFARAREVLELQVRQGLARREAARHLVEDLLQFDLPIAGRYKHLDVIRILQDNCSLLGPGLDALMRGLSILERYGKNLLRSDRPSQWRVVRFSNSIFKQEVDIIKGARKILKLLGYIQSIEDGLSYPDHCLIPNAPLVASVTADILLLRQELILLAAKEHPQERDFYSYAAAEQIKTVQIHFEERARMKSPETQISTNIPNSNLNSFSMPSPPTYNAVLQGAGEKTSIPVNLQQFQEPIFHPALNHIQDQSPEVTNAEMDIEIDEDELCDICGQEKSTLECRKCNKIFCLGCNKIWHSNPKRRNHERDIVAIEERPRDVPERSMMPGYASTNSSFSLQNHLSNESMTATVARSSTSPPIPHIQEQGAPGNHSLQPTISGERLRPTLNSRTSSLNEDNEWTRKVNRMAIDLMDMTNQEAQHAKLMKCLKELDERASKYKGGINQLMSKGSEKPSLVAHFQENITKIEDIKTQLKTLCGYEDPPEVFEAGNPNEFGSYSNIPSEGGWSFKSIRSEDDVQSNISSPQGNNLIKRPKLSEPVTVANLIDFSPDVVLPIVVNPSGFNFNSQTSHGPIDLSFTPLQHNHNQSWEADLGDIDEITRIKSAAVQQKSVIERQDKSMSAIKDPDLQSIFNVSALPANVRHVINGELEHKFSDSENLVIGRIQNGDDIVEPKSNVPRIACEFEKMKFEATPQNLDHVQVKEHEFTEPINLINNGGEDDFHSAMEIQPPAISRLEEQPMEVMAPLVPYLSPEELQARIRKEEFRFQTTQFLDLVRAGDCGSFRPEQVEVALAELEKEGNEMRSTPNSWLERKWTSHVKSFITFVKEKGIKISVESAEDVLLEGGYCFDKAYDLIIEAQNEQVKDLVSDEHDYEMAKRALLQNKGDKYLAAATLQKDYIVGLFKEFDEIEEDDEDDIDLLKKVVDIGEDKRKSHAFTAIFDFDKTSRAETLNALLLTLPNDMMTTLISDAIDTLTGDDVTDVDTALRYLDNECMICMDKFPRSKITCLPTCGDNGCMYCISCLEQHLTVCVKDKNIRDIVCPVCSLPETNSDEETLLNFFSHIDAILRRIADKKIHEIFQQKSRDFTLMRLPNFRWCSHCSGGFQWEMQIQNNKKMVCPFCRKATCYECKKPWETQHDGITCEQFKKWKESNDPEFQAAGLARHLRENGIDCPDCNFRYALAKGGCMHFKCTQCSHEFCSGCNSPFKNGKKCDKQLPSCHTKGLHAHHPRDCLFYLRDFNQERLQKLLGENKIEFDTKVTNNSKECQVMEQKETPSGMKDAVCGREIAQNCAGLCQLHYREYLVNLVNTHRLDPADTFNIAELKTCLLREDIPILQRPRGENEENYRKKLLIEVKKIPLKRQAQTADEE